MSGLDIGMGMERGDSRAGAAPGPPAPTHPHASAHASAHVTNSAARQRADLGHLAGAAAFLALYPGFFFYHSGLGLGLIGAMLGGFFSPVSLMAAPLLCYFYVHRVRHDRNYFTGFDLCLLLYLAYFGALVVVNAIAGANPVIVSNHVQAIIFILNTFLIFRMTDFGNRRLRLLLVLTLCAMSAIVFAYSVDGSFYLAPLGSAKNPESLATYQGFSRSYLFTFAAVIGFVRARRVRVLLYCLAAPTLFVNTARSEFAAMLFMIPIIELYFARRKLLMASVFALLFLLLYANLDQVLALLPSNRILELLDLSHSTSANKRHHLSMYAMNTIARFPAFGDYASYSPGFYSHNVLSAWVDTGFFGFLFVLGILLVPAVPMAFKGYFARTKSSRFILAFALCCITVLLLITSHYFTDMLIGATLGAYAAFRYGRKHGSHRAPDFCPPSPGHPYLHQAMPLAGAARP